MTLPRRTAARLFAGALLAGTAAGSAPPLVEAAKVGDLDHVQSLLEADPGAVNQSGPDGSTALHWAVNQDHLAMVEALLGADADALGPEPERVARPAEPGRHLFDRDRRRAFRPPVPR